MICSNFEDSVAGKNCETRSSGDIRGLRCVFVGFRWLRRWTVDFVGGLPDALLKLMMGLMVDIRNLFSP